MKSHLHKVTMLKQLCLNQGRVVFTESSTFTSVQSSKIYGWGGGSSLLFAEGSATLLFVHWSAEGSD